MSKKVLKLASRGRRLGAYVIDSIAPCIIGIIWVGCLSALIVSSDSSIYGYGYGYGYGYSYGNPYGGQSTAGLALGLIVPAILAVAYLGVQIIFYNKSQTIGKAILGLQVIDSTTGEPLGFWRMLLRELFAKKASSSVFFLGFIWVFIDEKNRTWHDKIADSYVIDLKESSRLAFRTASAVTEAHFNNEVKKTVETIEDKAVDAAEKILHETD